MTSETAADAVLTRWEGEPVRVWEARWGVPRLEVRERIGSTNDRARALAAGGAAPFTTVIAEEQVAGRGRGGRTWASPRGLGLWMSVVLPSPPASVGRGAHRLAPILVGVGVCRAVERSVGTPAGLKWPNDVLVGDRKVCGILCEGAGDAVVAGIGVNVRQRPADFPEEFRRSATSLEAASGEPVARGGLAGAVLAELRTLFRRPALRLEGALADEIRRRDVLTGRRVTVDGAPRGVARGIDASGALVVDDGGEPALVVAGTVRAAPD